MCQIKLAACLSVFQCKSSIVSYRIVTHSRKHVHIMCTLSWRVRPACVRACGRVISVGMIDTGAEEALLLSLLVTCVYVRVTQCYFSCDFLVIVIVKVIIFQVFQLQLQLF